MSQNKKILHDISKMASSAFSSAAGVKRDISSYIREQVEELLRGMNFVRREEFDAQHKTVLDNKKRLDSLTGTKDKAPIAKSKAATAPKKKVATAKTKAVAAPKKKAAITKPKAAPAKPKAVAAPKKKAAPAKAKATVAAPKKKAAPVKKTASKKPSPVKSNKSSGK